MPTTTWTCNQPAGTPKPPRVWKAPGQPDRTTLRADAYAEDDTAHVQGSVNGTPYNKDFTRGPDQPAPLWTTASGGGPLPEFLSSYFDAGTTAAITE